MQPRSVTRLPVGLRSSLLLELTFILNHETEIINKNKNIQLPEILNNHIGYSKRIMLARFR
jgi:hypothetical protein